ncbi:MAG TPA: DUF998 domain-containing protein [Chitinophagaceae bacterium]
MPTTTLYTASPDLKSQRASLKVGAARISFYLAVACLLLIVILHFLKNDLAPDAHMLSEYAIGEFGWVMQLAFFCWAASCVSLPFVLRPFIANTKGRVGLMLLVVTGLALIMGGIFIIDSPYDAPPVPTQHGSLHGVSAMIGLPGQAIATLLISYSLVKNDNWQSARKYILVWAHLTWISLVLMFASTFIMFAVSNGKFSGETGIGWFNRLLVLVYCGGLITVSRHALQINKTLTSISKR